MRLRPESENEVVGQVWDGFSGECLSTLECHLEPVQSVHTPHALGPPYGPRQGPRRWLFLMSEVSLFLMSEVPL